MKAYKLEILVVDQEGYGQEQVKQMVENVRGVIGPFVLKAQEADIGDWNDDHPLNDSRTREAECLRLFGRRVLIPPSVRLERAMSFLESRAEHARSSNSRTKLCPRCHGLSSEESRQAFERLAAKYGAEHVSYDARYIIINFT